MPEKKVKIRDLAPTAVRLAPEIRHALQREAAINGRTLHAEIVLRLSRSLDGHGIGPGTNNAGEAVPPAFVQQLADSERSLLSSFRKMAPEKQLALMTLLR